MVWVGIKALRKGEILSKWRGLWNDGLLDLGFAGIPRSNGELASAVEEGR
jgi:hypothetical protein